jgi:glycine/D-amino acid oxidase-like deaminating enzyme
MQAPAVGRLLAQELLGGEPEIDISAYSPARFADGAALEPEAAVI